MDEQMLDPRERALEARSRALFEESVERIDMPTRSRLTQARHAALEAADRAGRRAWLLRMPVLTSAAGLTAAAVLGVALWFGGPVAHHPAVADSNFEDLDMVASSDEGSGDALEMLQDDIDFYAWADKAAGSEPSA